jgi:hypothetical protein
MPRSTGRKKPSKTSVPRRGPPQQPPWWNRHWKTVTKIVGLVVVTVGFCSALATFLPHVTVESGGPIDPSDPYPISFTITNTSIIPLTDIQPEIGLCKIVWGPPRNLPERCEKMLTFLVFTPWFVKRLTPSEPYTIHLEDFLNIRGPSGLAQFGAADISIKVDYSLGFLSFWPFRSANFWPFRSAKEYRFQTSLAPDGKLWWRHRPLEK